MHWRLIDVPAPSTYGVFRTFEPRQPPLQCSAATRRSLCFNRTSLAARYTYGKKYCSLSRHAETSAIFASTSGGTAPGDSSPPAERGSFIDGNQETSDAFSFKTRSTSSPTRKRGWRHEWSGVCSAEGARSLALLAIRHRLLCDPTARQEAADRSEASLQDSSRLFLAVAAIFPPEQRQQRGQNRSILS